MPELPEVETVVNGIRPAFLKNTIKKIICHRPNLRFVLPKKDLKNLQGLVVKKVFRRSKYILMEIDDRLLLMHLGMTGKVFFSSAMQSKEPHAHVSFGIESPKGKVQWMHYVDPRRFGYISVLALKNWEQHPYFKTLGPEPLEIENLGAHLFQKAQNKKAPIKNFLMDQKNVVGVGNIYACESLFLAKIHPECPAGRLGLSQFKALSLAIQKTLTQAIEQGGTTIRDFQSADGSQGYFAIELKVYGRENEACKKCKVLIQRIKQAGRSTWYCPSCQKLDSQ